MAVQTKSETSFQQYKHERNRCRERIGKLTNHAKISSLRKFR